MNRDQQVLSDLIPSLPKVLLHDHLDGGLRPQTVIELAQDIGHELPSSDPDELAAWFTGGGLSSGLGSGDDAGVFGTLEQYLETFAHTTAVMQTAEALTRVAREAVIDLAADGVVYAEQRWAPELHLAGGLNLDQAVAAVQRGLQQGMAEAAAQGQTIYAYQLLCAMRQNDRWDQIADLAIRWLGRDGAVQPPVECPEVGRVETPDVSRPRFHSTDGGLQLSDGVAHSTDGCTQSDGTVAPGAVVGVDLAGPESGFPPDGPQADVWLRLAEAGVPVTIHAGEGDGLESIAKAVYVGRALRLGHGVRIIDDVATSDSRTASGASLGPLANWVRDRRIPLEVAVRSNVQTRAAGATSVANHPITPLMRAGFAVTVNTDNRLMSRTSMSTEMRGLVRDAGWSLGDLYEVTITAAKHAFIHDPQRRQLIHEEINPRFAAVGEAVMRGRVAE